MDERIHLVSLQRTGWFRLAELAESFGVSRKTAYKWVARYAAEGTRGLAERSRAPHRPGRVTDPGVVQAVLRAKARHPAWGPAKLFPGLEEPPEIVQAWPAPSTRGAILARYGLVTPRRRRGHVPPWTQPFQAATAPNRVWCADFKGWRRTQDGARCGPLTVSDAYSRMLLACQALPQTDTGHVRPVLERLFQEYGLPGVIRTDNGAPFAAKGAGGLSPLAIWWIKLGILPERIRPGHPEENGRLERLHATLGQATMHPLADTLAAQQQRFDAFRQEYNTERPHQALGQVPPATCYVPSARPYPAGVGDAVYPEGIAVRRVRSTGQIKWRGERVFISASLIGELVSVTEHDGGWLVAFGPIALGMLRPRRETLDRQRAGLPFGPWVPPP